MKRYNQVRAGAALACVMLTFAAKTHEQMGIAVLCWFILLLVSVELSGVIKDDAGEDVKLPWPVLKIGLDQLMFGGFLHGETVQDRAEAIETFLKQNGWTWDMVLDAMWAEDHSESTEKGIKS